MKTLILVPLACYLGLIALMYFTQRNLLYFPDPTRHAPAAVGLTRAEAVTLDTADGERVIAWHVPAQGAAPVVIYFQGNAGGLNLRASRFRALTTDGIGLVALNYRGYGGSSGRPSETGLIADAHAAYAFASSRYAPERIVVWGESLGTGVAVALAAERPVGRVVLESPYTSIVELAAAIYWFAPVRWLIKDPFRSDRRIAKVAAPVLVLHGARDTLIPIGTAERLYGLIQSPKTFVRLPEAGHNDHDAHGAVDIVRAFVRGGAIN